MKRLVLLSLVVLTTACTQGVGMTPDPPYSGYPTQQERAYPRQSTRQSDPLTDASRQSRSVRTIVQNIMGITRDIGR